MRQDLDAASAGDFRGAEISFRRAVTLEPKYDFALCMLGLTLLCLSKKVEACTQLAKSTIAYFPSITMRQFTANNLSAMLAILRFC